MCRNAELGKTISNQIVIVNQTTGVLQRWMINNWVGRFLTQVKVTVAGLIISQQGGDNDDIEGLDD